MTLTPDEIAALIAVLIALLGALANYLNHLSNVKQIAILHTKVDAIAASPPVTTPVAMIDGHAVPPVPHG